ncbi:MAG TPA: PAS domain S-box protein, partial [Thermoplasmata archaeon]|nr:PAS domain S-box protein [Thermoplasmata archaeon]
MVEDESIVAMDISTTLQSLGYEVVGTAATGEDAIVMAEEKRPDLILMDIVLKGDMDGVEAAEQIRSILDIPVVYLTAYSDDQTLARAKLTEPFGYILKPFEERELHTNIEMALYKHMLERSLRESEEKFRTITTAALDAIIKINNEGRVVLWNPGAEKIFGYSAGEMLGRDVHEALAPEDDLKRFRKRFAEFRRTGRGPAVGRVLELEAIRKDGTRIPIEISLSSVMVQGQWNAIAIIRDISERKQAERELREAKERFEVLFNSGNDMIFVHEVADDGTAGRIIAVNDMATETLGYSREELIGMTPADIRLEDEVHPETRRIISGERTSALIERTLRASDGREIPVEINLRTFDLSGQRAVLAIARNITERKEAQRALEESEANLRDLFDNATDLIQQVDPEGRILSVNRAWCETLGYTREEALAMNVMDIICPDHRAECMAMFKRVMNGETLRLVETEFYTKDGRRIIVEGNVNSRIEDGKVVHTRGFFRDITERKQAERAREESERKYIALVERANDGIVIISEGRLTFWNDKVLEVTGYTAEGIDGIEFLDLIAPEYREMVAERHIARLEGKPVPSQYEIELVRKDGSRVPVEVNAIVIDLSGEPVVLAYIRDITERKRAETLERERAKG